MKSTFALIGAYAALASAFTPGRHLHFPRGNGTMTSSTSSSTSSIGSTSTSISAPLTTAPSSAGAGITTLTVKTTRTSTIISCAPTVTNCPVGQKTTEIVTMSNGIALSSPTVSHATPACTGLPCAGATGIKPSTLKAVIASANLEPPCQGLPCGGLDNNVASAVPTPAVAADNSQPCHGLPCGGKAGSSTSVPTTGSAAKPLSNAVALVAGILITALFL